MSNQGTVRLKVLNSAPSVEKLWNGRYRLEFLCDNNSAKLDWYYDDIGGILPDYGILQETSFGTGVGEDWQAIPASVFPNMRLVETGYVFIPSIGDKRVQLAYETLTASWVEEKAEDTNNEVNGLKSVSRTFVALPATAYTYVVGTTTITVDGLTLYLASSKIEKTDAKWQLSEVWVEAGELSRSNDLVGSQKSLVISTIGVAPATPSGYSLAKTDINNVGGLQSTSYTFLKPSVISVQQQFNNGLKTVSVQVFDMTSTNVSAELSAVTSNHELLSQNESDYEGIKTSVFTYQINESFTEDYELNGLKRISLIELSSSNFSAQVIGNESSTSPVSGLYLGIQEIDNGGIIKLRESVWFEAGKLSVRRRSESEGVYRVTETFLGDVPNDATVGPIVEIGEDDFDGLKTTIIVSLQDSSGGSLITAESQPIASHAILSEFTYPGVVTIDSTTLSGTDNTYTFNAKDFSLKPPCVSRVPATIKVSFKTSSDITYSPSNGLWNPTTWAQGFSRGIAWNYLPFSISRGFRGYRIDSSAGVINNYSGTGTEDPFDMVSGKRIFHDTAYEIEVSSGPADPEGEEYTLEYDVTLAFEDSSGVSIYKHREVTSTIPVR